MRRTLSPRLLGALIVAGGLAVTTSSFAQHEASPDAPAAATEHAEADREEMTAALLIDSTAVPERAIRRALTRHVEGTRFVRLVDVDETDDSFVGTLSIVVADNGLRARILFSVDGGGSAHRDLTRGPLDDDTEWIVEAVQSLITHRNPDELLVPAAWSNQTDARVPSHELIDPWRGAYPTSITRHTWQAHRVPRNELVVPPGWNRRAPRTDIHELRELEPAGALSEPAPSRRPRRSR